MRMPGIASMRWWLVAAGCVGASVGAIAACSSDGGEAEAANPGGAVETAGHAGSSGAGSGGATSGGSGGASAGASGSGVGVGCSPVCSADQQCSALNTCIPKGTCVANGDCTAGLVCDTQAKKCVPGGACGSQKIAAQAVPSNLLVVLDRSCSMTTKLASGKTKWEAAVAALSAMTKTYAKKIRFGLTMFPDKTGDACVQEPSVLIPIGDGNETKITSLLTASLAKTDMYFPSSPCVTNIDTGMLQAAKDPGLADKAHEAFTLLITDGEQSSGCTAGGGANGATKAIADLSAKNVPTFVVGFGSGVSPTQLDAFATAGGEAASPTTPKFFKAEDQPSLDKALSTIAGKAIGCVFKLESAPPDPGKLFVFFDKKESIAKDATHKNGWDYDPASMQVSVYGARCDDLKTGKVTAVDIVFGCETPPEQ